MVSVDIMVGIWSLSTNVVAASISSRRTLESASDPNSDHDPPPNVRCRGGSRTFKARERPAGELSDAPAVRILSDTSRLTSHQVI